MLDRLLFRLPKIKQQLFGLAVLAVLQALFIIGQAFFLSQSIVHVWQGASAKSQLGSIGLFFLFFMLRQLSVTYCRKELEQYAAKQASTLRQQLLTKLWHLGPAFVQKEGTGNTVTLAIEGIQQIEDYLTLILPKLVNMLIMPWLIAIFLFFLDKRSAVILVLVFPLIIVFMVLLGHAARAKADRQYAGFQKLSNHFIDALRGLKALKQLGLSKRYAKNIFQVSEEYRRATMSTLKVAVLSTFALDFFTTLSVAIIAVFLGLALMEGKLLLFPALVILLLAPDFFLPLREFANDYHATLNGSNTLKQLYSYLDRSEFAPIAQLSLTKGWTETDTFQAQNVTLNYSDTENDANTNTERSASLKEWSFHWQGYGKIGIVGLSGAGKSTLIKLLGGFLEPTAGAFGINGQKLAHLQVSAWQNQLLYIPQKPYIFHATLAENIAFYTPQATEQQIRQAAKQAGLLAMLAELPMGLNTYIGEGGQTLSGGQLQRIALARAFLDPNRRILLFDEPTAHLDIETEVEIKQSMLPLFADHLVFFATHRLHWMREMDQIIVLDHGQVQAVGTHQDLSEHSSVYQNLVNDFSGGLPDEKN